MHTVNIDSLHLARQRVRCSKGAKKGASDALLEPWGLSAGETSLQYTWNMYIATAAFQKVSSAYCGGLSMMSRQILPMEVTIQETVSRE